MKTYFPPSAIRCTDELSPGDIFWLYSDWSNRIEKGTVHRNGWKKYNKDDVVYCLFGNLSCIVYAVDVNIGLDEDAEPSSNSFLFKTYEDALEHLEFRKITRMME